MVGLSINKPFKVHCYHLDHCQDNKDAAWFLEFGLSGVFRDRGSIGGHPTPMAGNQLNPDVSRHIRPADS